MDLPTEEITRYARHLSLPEVGLDGQLKLRQASVLCIGAGGLGSPLAMYLAAAGVGRLGLVDFDVVDLSNLQRQIMHGQQDIGRPKVDSARETLTGINPHVNLEMHACPLTRDNAMGLLQGYDVIVDGTDNFATRYLTNDVCFFLKKPNVYGSIFRFEGQLSVFAPHLGGPCYRCLYPEPPPPGMVPSCAEGGVLGVLPGVVGCLQATEVIKLLLGQGASMIGRLLTYHAMDMKFRELKLRRDPECPLCGEQPSIRDLVNYEDFCGVTASHDPNDMHPDEVTVQEMKRALDDPQSGIQVIDVREEDEWRIARVEGTTLLPLSQLAERYTELDPNQSYYLHCKAGVRSLKALDFLRQQGFGELKSVQGGISAWSGQIDPNVPAY
ncbi:MAG: molybdopterin-synthase adenylyltransferase MoeB [Limisphaerales bacterium]|jgi:molybdopterin/thiamine biosynthesis adenylyltransferase/rhodanese-related sulfurtransferase